MEDFRSRSSGDGRMQIQSYNAGGGGEGGGLSTNDLQDFRCYSASYASSVHPAQEQVGNDLKLKKGKSMNSFSSMSWSCNDPELQRRKRVASYKVYAVEGRVKGSFRKSFKWLKERCSKVVFGW